MAVSNLETSLQSFRRFVAKDLRAGAAVACFPPIMDFLAGKLGRKGRCWAMLRVLHVPRTEGPFGSLQESVVCRHADRRREPVLPWICRRFVSTHDCVGSLMSHRASGFSQDHVSQVQTVACDIWTEELAGLWLASWGQSFVDESRDVHGSLLGASIVARRTMAAGRFLAGLSVGLLSGHFQL